MFGVVLLLWCASGCCCAARKYDEWIGRTVYMVLTDRFAKSSPSDALCDGNFWCGGTLRGVINNIDYIQSMGFDAVWITPVVKQVPWTDRWNGTGYHGYWAQDFHQIEPHIGTEQDLLELSAALHARGMLLMLDVVANHVGPLHNAHQISSLGKGIDDNTSFPPQLHQLGRAEKETLQEYLDNPRKITDAGDCWPNYVFDPSGRCNYTVLLDGWFGDLGDLRQEDPATAKYLTSWIKKMVTYYNLDGLRLDTAFYMPKDFLSDFQQQADLLILGEVVMQNFTLHRSFIGPLSSLLNFPLTEHLMDIFSSRGNMNDLHQLLVTQANEKYPLNGALLGNFIDNHDSDRFLFNHSNEGAHKSLMQMKNALAFVLLWQGIPVVYYGTESVSVSNMSDARTSMWQTGYRSNTLTAFLSSMHSVRRKHGLAHGGEYATASGTVLAVDSHRLTFQRGGLTVTINNIGLEPVFGMTEMLLL
eukprot:TRINITY_DN6620_c0_g1_i2.p1 TRINITY_DN6620_c0_g1~~TRINITY_DN6620_c0_g1_i2.p1  ORF type:complete len:473 (-),score=42.71 TRINITY_DN6620_c0_g1_i2:76-1494(-)